LLPKTPKPLNLCHLIEMKYILIIMIECLKKLA